MSEENQEKIKKIKPKKGRVGNFQIEIKNIFEDSSKEFYSARGLVNISFYTLIKTYKKKALIIGKQECKIKETIGHKVTIQPNINTQLYHPTNIAKIAIKEFQKNNYDVKQIELETALAVMMNDYVNTATQYSNKGKKLFGQYITECKL